MHEAGAVTRALDAAYGPAGHGRAGETVQLTIHDPVRAEAGVVSQLAMALLQERGAVDTRVAVAVEPRTCAACRLSGVPSPADATCPGCGMPYPTLDGPAVTVVPGGR
jgi:hypothetical protein